MDVNDYQPLGVKILSSLQGYTTPEILDDAKRGNLNEELQVNKGKIGDLLDGRIPSSNPQNEVYKLLLTGVCNHLHKTFPFLFERIDDYTELLLPDDLTSEFSIIQDIRNGMSKEDCEEVEIIGWLYQFYISEKKDEVFASKDKVKKEDIPAATQLFTPRWIVEYMVQNTVGKLWLLNNPTSRLKDHMPYYIESVEKDNDFLKIDSVEEITLLDQACGSGHILVYGFELLTKIYEEQGYNTSEIPQLIINKNLFGFEIDERAAQLSGFALLMKAREYNRRVFRKELKPNILCYKDLKLTEEEIKETFTQLKIELTDELLFDLKNIQQATNLGSLISPHPDATSIKEVIDKVVSSKSSSDVFLRYRLEELEGSLEHLLLLSKKYHCVVDNPPYMGGGKMNKELSAWVKTNYPSSKSDLLTCFVERAYSQVQPKGYLGFVTMESWMFLSSFETFRKTLLENHQIESLSHFGWHIMRIAFGTCSFILKSNTKSSNSLGAYNYMEFDNINKLTERPKVFPVIDNGRYNHVNQKDFSKIPGSPIGYWLSETIVDLFSESASIKEKVVARQGMATGNNERFIRLWYEISQVQLNLNAHSNVEAFQSDKRFFPYNKGGEFKRWFGNQLYIICFSEEDYRILKSMGNHCPSEHLYFKPSVSWARIGSGLTSFRFYPKGFLFDQSGHSLFIDDTENVRYLMGFLNTSVYENLTKAVNPTLNLEVGNIGQLPFPEKINISENQIVDDCIQIARSDWNAREFSWDFSRNELINQGSNTLNDSYDLYKQYWVNKFFQLHKNEEELNRQFIDIYGLQDELSPDVSLEEITILKEETDIINGELVFDQKEVFSQFVSYAVGCMFGRYSLDKEGLILANQGETLQDYLLKVDKQESELSFVPDDDNIIPILDDEWFEDDIVGRFHAFLKASFGEQNFEKNLSFVEESIGKDIRKYFVKDFYKDHIKRYKKRPIYWMFSSPKGSFNVLVYMHRYTPDTLNQVLNGYLNEYREKLKTRIETLDHLMVSGSPSEQNKASKEKDKIQMILLELQEYEREILYPLATERISIDLDDGVLVNYNKFGKAIASVAGLNDKKAKEKVKKFDWIDTTTIR
jgi:SAM-dependent methyltransferase